MKTVKKVMIISIISILALAIILFVICKCCFIEHNVKLTLIEERQYDSSYSYSYGEKYFFLKDDKYNNFYNGIELLEYYLPEYDFSQLNVKEYTYLIAVNGEVSSVKYSGKNCNYRTYLGLPYEYKATIDYKPTDDDIIRIYQFKKINIDYDYHSE